MNFVAIDFETANEKRNSPCSIGIVVVNNNKIVEKIHCLIKPKEMRFMPINIGIHGIRPGMVENELEFDQVWNKINKYFNGNLVVAHNASFDISVLRKTLELYDIEVPTFEYVCTMKLSRNFYTQIDNAKLSTVNNFLGYEFDHHDALADALACSNILLSISKELESNDIGEICTYTGVTIGSVDKDGYKPSSSKGRVQKISQMKSLEKEKNMYEKLNYDAFKDEIIVFTGRLKSMPRDEAIRMVRRLGGNVGSSVTRKTTILVTNMKNIHDLKRSEMSTKLRKAIDLNEKGQEINLLNEEDFLQKLF